MVAGQHSASEPVKALKLVIEAAAADSCECELFSKQRLLLILVFGLSKELYAYIERVYNIR